MAKDRKQTSNLLRITAVNKTQMKILNLIQLAMLISSSLFGQSDCEKFKTGKFKNIENGILKSTIQRNDSIQIEEYAGKKVRPRIIWESDCSYRLSFLSANDNWQKTKPKNELTADLLVRITEVNENTYVQEAKFEGDLEYEYTSTIEKTD